MIETTKDNVREEPTATTAQVSGATLSRRMFVGAASLAGAGLLGGSAFAQTRPELKAGRTGDNASDPGPENKTLLAENPNSNNPPFTDHGNPGDLWYSFDLTPKRLQGGGWTHQVTERELPTSKDIAGVNMRLTAGSFRELHWHTSDEWAIMLTGNARVTVMDIDGKMFINDVAAGDLWYFPAGLPHSIQGLGPDGCEFLLVFNDGLFSEDNTFLLSETLAHTPPEMVQKNMGWSRAAFDKLPATELYIFEAPLPGPIEDDRRFLGANLGTGKEYTFKLTQMAPTFKHAGGEVRIVDTTNFPISKGTCGAMVTLKPGGIREMHWHPNASEWQYWIRGKGRMTVTTSGAKARTVDFHANDVGYVPLMAAHTIENTGTEDLVFLEMFKAPRYEDISVNQWIARMPPKMAEAHLKLAENVIREAPQNKAVVLPE